MILQSFQNRLNTLKSNGEHIQYVLDIGAYRGDFTETIKSVWPFAIIRQIEADDRQQQFLQDNAIIALLGNEIKDDVDFYTLSENSITTGSSIFKELTHHYSDVSTVVIKKSMTTIDFLHKKHKFYGNWKEHGLIKIDTQGSELLILEGATDFINTAKPRYILLECSVMKYNQGAPMISDVYTRMNQLGYTTYDIFDLSYTANNQLLQMDVLFKRNE